MTRKRPTDPTDEVTADPIVDDAAGPAETGPGYDVGYRRPPEHSRFKPGQSGNRRGRPKGARNVETEIRDELFGTITVMENGRRKKMPRVRALIRRLMEKGFAGDVRSASKLLDMASRLVPDETRTMRAELTSDESDLLDLLSRRALANSTGAGDA